MSRAVLLAAVALFGLQVLVEAFHPAVNRFADLQVYVGSTRSLLGGGSLYDYVRGNGDVFTYPPAAGYLLVWTGWLPTPVVGVAWSVLSAGAFAVLAFSLAAGLGPTGTSTTSLRGDPWGLVGVVAVVLVISAPARSNIAFGQASVIVVALAAADLLLLANRRTAGVLLGVAIAVKLTPLLFVPLLWWSCRRRQALTAIATGAAVTAAAWLIFPAQSEAYWLHDVVDAGRFVDVSIAGNQSLRAFLERAGVHNQLVWLAVAAFLAALSVAIGVRLARQQQWFLAVGVVGTCSVIVSPISWTHHQFWLLAPALWALVQSRPRVRFSGAVVLLVMTIGVIDASPALGPVGWLITDLRLLAALAVLTVAALVSIRTRHSGEPNDADLEPVSGILTGPSRSQ